MVCLDHCVQGVNCRFGNRGIIAEAHHDGGRNFIAMVKGAKRYIILPPDECRHLYITGKNHPQCENIVPLYAASIHDTAISPAGRG